MTSKNSASRSVAPTQLDRLEPRMLLSTTLFDFERFGDNGPASNFDTVGSAEILNRRIRLTPDAPNQVGAAWYPQAINLQGDASFSTSFSFRIDGGGADTDGEGFAFVLQPDGPSAVSAFTGNSLGYQRLRNSVAIEFDTIANAFGEVSGNHIAVHVNGDRANPVNGAEVDVQGRHNAGQNRYVWIEFDDSVDRLDVYLSGTDVRPGTPTLTTTLDVRGVTGNSVYAGFTGSTSNRRNAQKINSWALTVANDPDAAGSFRFLERSIQVDEGAGIVDLTIVRNGGSSGAARVVVGNQDVTAIKGQDYGLVRGVVDFENGQTSATLPVRIRDDSQVEALESARLYLASTDNGEIQDINTLVLKIADNDAGGDPAQVQLVGPITVLEDEGLATITLRRSGDVQSAFALQVTTTPGTASAGSDFTATTQNISFLETQGQQTFTIPIVNDGTAEETEVFTVDIVSLTNASVDGNDSLKVTILDDDFVDSNAAPVNRRQVGLNLERLGSGSTQWDFADLMKNAGAWAYTGGDPRSGQAVQTLTDNGYPILQNGEQARTVVRNWSNGEHDAFPGGTYTIQWEGTGRLQLAGWVNSDIQESSGGSNSFQVDIPRANGVGASLRINIIESDPNDPIRDVRFYMPGYEPGEANAGQTFHQTFVDDLAPVGILRFMDWMEGPTNSQEAWSQRNTPDDFSYAISGGASVEAMVELANAVQADAWFNMPARANDNFIRKFAQYVRDNLDDNLTIYLEYGNEVWASTVGGNPANAVGFNYVTQRANQTGNDFITQWADEMERDFDLFTTEFGNQSNRIQRVAAGQARNRDSVNRQLLEALAADGDLGVDVLGLAAYVRADPAQVGDWNNPATYSPTVEDMLQTLNYDLSQQVDDTLIQGGSRDGQATGLWSWHRQLADEFNLDLIAYEGGQQLAPNSNTRTWFDEYVAVQSDPAIGQVYADLLHTYLNDAGGDAYIHYTSVGKITSFGAWGLKEYQNQPTADAPKWESVVSYVRSGVKFDDWTYSVTEGENATLKLVRSGDLSQGTSVRLTTRATTAQSNDFNALNTTVNFAPNQSELNVNLGIIDDNTWEGAERVYVDATTTDGRLSLGSALVKIADNDQPTNGFANRDILGTNFDKLDAIGSEFTYTDITQVADQWQYPQGTPNQFEFVPTNENNYPILAAGESAFSFAKTRNDDDWGSKFPEGTYTLTWRGRGKIEVFNGKPTNPNREVYSFTSNGGVNTERIFLTGDQGRNDNITIFLTNEDGRANIRDIHLYMPGYGPGQVNAGQIFHQDMFSEIEPFSIVRYMDWFETNFNEVEAWEDRAVPNSGVYSAPRQGAGVPIEDVVAHANQALANPWLNMPARANDEYVRNLAEYVKENLDPRLTVYLEWGNEVWAPTVAGRGDLAVGYNYITERMQEVGRDLDDNQGRMDQWAEEMRRDFDIWFDVYGEQSDNLQRVAASQGRNRTSVNEQLLTALHRYGQQDIEVFSPAAYIRVNDFALLNDWNQGNATPTVDEVLEQLQSDLDDKVNEQIATTGGAQGQPIGLWSWHRSLADQYGVKLIAYEGGQQLFTQNGPWVDIMAEAQRDPRMYTLYQEFLDKYLNEAGADGLVHYANVSSITPFGAWGAKEYTNQPIEETTKYRAIVEFAQGLSNSPGAPSSTSGFTFFDDDEEDEGQGGA